MPDENESSQAVPSTSEVEKEESNVDNIKEASDPDIIVQSTFGRDSFEDEEENTVEVPGMRVLKLPRRSLLAFGTI